MAGSTEKLSNLGLVLGYVNVNYEPFTMMEKAPNHKALAYKGISTPTNAHSSIKACLISKSKLMWEETADCHDILCLLDRTGF